MGPEPHLGHQVCAFPVHFLLIRLLVKFFVIFLIEYLGIMCLLMK